MMPHSRGRTGSWLAISLSAATGAAAWVFCPDDFELMPMTLEAPWSAVGYLNNGCTGVLVDPRHVLAAAHCFSFGDGAWQKNLWFYPNFHPDRPGHVAYGFDRVVVGSRTDLGPPEFVGRDWGIGHLTAPVTGFEPVPIRTVPSSKWTRISSAGYPRDLLYLSHRTPPPGGFCTFGKDELPLFCGSAEKEKVSRCWWTNGVIDPDCRIYDQASGALKFDCRTLGGNSGSPLFWNQWELESLPFELRRRFYVGGVVHGYSQDPCTSCLQHDVDSNFHNAGANAINFQYAPRFPSGVAVSRVTTGTRRTRVLAFDRDEKRLVSRSRFGTLVDGPMLPFALEKAPPVTPRQVEAISHFNRPLVMIISEQGTLYAGMRVGVPGLNPVLFFDHWIPVPLPSRADGVVDLDALDRKGGSTDDLYALLHLRTTPQPSGVPYRLRVKWPSYAVLPKFEWEALPASRETYARIAAVQRPDFLTQLFLVSSGSLGDVRTMWRYLSGGWSAPVGLGRPAGTAVRDIDVTTMYAPFGEHQTQLLAVAGNGEIHTLYRFEGEPPEEWNGWFPWRIGLFAPGNQNIPPPEGLMRITATQWQEDSAELRPVVFATDQFGNIYHTEQRRCGSSGPICIARTNGWRSFYN